MEATTHSTEAFADYIHGEIEKIRSEGVRTYNHIADVLNSRGVTTTHGDKWNGTAIAKLMASGKH